MNFNDIINSVVSVMQAESLGFEEAIECLPGDISQEVEGLSPAEYRVLCKECHRVNKWQVVC